MTVSIVIAKITVQSPAELAQVRIGLFLAALISGALGLAWLKRFPASLK
jgi:NhaA family Na+:H+ antiporter